MGKIMPSESLPAIDPHADARFRQMLVEQGMAPDQRFVRGYVDWEWRHARHLFLELPQPIAGRRVLEFGCHLGATAIVLALLGAEVVATDVDPQVVALARVNAERYGVGHRIQFLSHDPTRPLPFADAAFDVVSCNSVLEYVDDEQLAATQGELHRVLRPGGLLLVMGTSNRLWPREVHSRQWLSNYVPRFLDHLLPARLRRGLMPSTVRDGFPGCRDLLAEDPGALARSKARMGASPWKLRVLGAVAPWLRKLRLSPSALAPTLTMWLHKSADQS
jgi:ubiquinone/menaquinone biosynthesis C-methylase UbiE